MSPVTKSRHAGFFTCQASYHGKTDKFEAQIDVRPITSYLPPPFINRTEARHISQGREAKNQFVPSRGCCKKSNGGISGQINVPLSGTWLPGPKTPSRTNDAHSPLEILSFLEASIAFEGMGRPRGFRRFRKTHLENILPRGSRDRDPRYPKGVPWDQKFILKKFL